MNHMKNTEEKEKKKDFLSSNSRNYKFRELNQRESLDHMGSVYSISLLPHGPHAVGCKPTTSFTSLLAPGLSETESLHS